MPEHKPAVNKIKNGNSFFGNTDTSWNVGNNSRSAASVHWKIIKRNR